MSGLACDLGRLSMDGGLGKVMVSRSLVGIASVAAVANTDGGSAAEPAHTIGTRFAFAVPV